MKHNFSVVELGLLITGLRAIHVADAVEAHAKLLQRLETELANRNFKVRE